MKTSICLISVLGAALTINAQDSVEAMLNYMATTQSGGSPFYSPIISDINGPVGWTFQPLADIDVTALGAFSYIVPRTVLKVGLWDASGTLLASETITPSSAPVNQSLYQSISPVMLSANQTYYLAAYAPAGPLQAIVVSPETEPNGYATMSPEIQLGEIAYSTNSSFVFPATTDGTPGYAIIAPNFEYVVVPEPPAFYLLGSGSLLWLMWRRKINSPAATE